ncbi:MAG: peptidoglycan editing factor PgeF [Xanthomonadales bacterium]|nr:peptidoglycan editing factor PgeF [Xanthomonadales bacterium]
MSWIEPQWPVPASVAAISTLRTGGVSQAPFDSFNLGAGSGDDPNAVAANRERLRLEAGLPGEPCWLRQVHGTRCVEAGPGEPEADASWTADTGTVLAILTADCLPVLLYSGEALAAVHAGWRGLCAGIIEQTLVTMPGYVGRTVAWLGPAIGSGAYEVGEEVRSAAIGEVPEDGDCFVATRPGHWLMDLYGLARRRLQRAGVSVVTGGDYCTHSEPERFFSFRRDGQTGRMATLVWLR